MRKTLLQALLAAISCVLAHGASFLEGGRVMLIGLRNGMMACGRISAKSYVQDGLVAMWGHLRAEREDRGYTTREPDAYLTSEVPRWRQDAEDWVRHRDYVMEYALDLMNAVESGTRPPPTLDEFVSNLPAISWSYAEAEVRT